MSEESGAAESSRRDDCPSAATLAAWDSGRLTTKETERIARHLENCPHCATANATAAADEELISWTLMQSPVSGLDEPELAKALTALLDAPETIDAAHLPDEAWQTDWAASDGSAFPERIGSYVLVRPLGRGAMGWVFEAEHVNLRRRVALKLLPPTAQFDGAHVARFYEEMAAVGKLSHPHIVQAFDAGEADGHHYLAMELVAGCDASKLVKRLGPLTIADACELTRQVAVALKYIHTHEMAHRDVKPSNVMITPQGQVKLLDLGLATIRDVAERDFAVAGTAEYMAPERWDSQDAAGLPADLYALGCMLFKLLLGTTPYAEFASASNPLSEAHRSANVPSARAARLEIPVELDAFIARLLAKRPQDRPTAAETIAALAAPGESANLRSLIARAILVDSDADTLPPSRTWTSIEPAPTPRPRRRHMARVVASCAAVVALVGAACGGYWFYDRGEVVITVDPPGTTILLDNGSRRIEIPGEQATISLASGKHTLVASKPGYQERTERLEISPRERAEIRFTLDVEPLIIESTGQWVAQPHGVAQFAVSPDGSMALTAGDDGVLRLWNIGNQQLEREFVGQLPNVHALEFSPQGDLILSGGDDRIARIWDVKSGRELKRLVGHTSDVLCAKFSHDGKRVVTGSGDATVRVWDLETTECLWTGQAHCIWVRDVAFSADDAQIISGANDTLSIVWDARTGDMRRALVGQNSVVLSTEFSSDGKRALTGGYDRQAILWDVEREERMRGYIGHAEAVVAKFAPGEHFVVTASMDGELRYWSVDHHLCLARFVGHTSGVRDMEFLPDGRTMLSSSLDGTVRQWSLPRPEELPVVPREYPATLVAAADPPPEVLRVPPTRTWLASNRPLSAIAMSSDGTKLATAGEDGLARIWDRESGERIHELSGATDHLLAVAFAPDGALVATGGKDRLVRIYDVATGELSQTASGHTSWITGLSFMAGGPWLVSSSTDSTLRAYNVLLHQPHVVMTEGCGWIRAVAFSPNLGSSYVVCAGNNAQMTRWEVGAGMPSARWQPQAAHLLSSVAYSHDGRLAAAAGWNASFDVWDMVDDSHVATVPVRQGAITGLAFLPDGERMVTVGEDFSARIFQFREGRELARLTGPTTSLRGVATSGDGRWISAVALDGRVFVWATPDMATQRTAAASNQ